MSTIDPTIAAAQAEYNARPFAARVVTAFYSGTSRFNTEAEAIAHIFYQARIVQKRIAKRQPGNSAWDGFDCYRSYVEYPGGLIIQARWILWLDRIETPPYEPLPCPAPAEPLAPSDTVTFKPLYRDGNIWEQRGDWQVHLCIGSGEVYCRETKRGDMSMADVQHWAENAIRSRRGTLASARIERW